MNDDSSPFMVIACESPTYESRFFGFGDPQRRSDRTFAGTACLIGGGSVTASGVARPHGLMQACLGEATWLVPEAIAAWLAENVHHVILVEEPAFNGLFVESARRAGMKVMGKPDCIVCQGPGRAMRRIHCFNLHVCSPSALLAFRADGAAFERALIRYVRKGIDIGRMLDAFWMNGWGRKIDYRHFCCLAVSLGGIEGSDMIINTTLADADAIKQRCREHAEELDVVLYDSGSIVDLDWDNAKERS